MAAIRFTSRPIDIDYVLVWLPGQGSSITEGWVDNYWSYPGTGRVVVWEHMAYAFPGEALSRCEL